MSRTEILSRLNAAAVGQPFKRWNRFQVGTWLSDVIQSLLEDINFEVDIKEAQEAIREFYNSTVRPIDIPKIPGDGTSNSILDMERYLDDAILQGLLITAELLINRFTQRAA